MQAPAPLRQFKPSFGERRVIYAAEYSREHRVVSQRVPIPKVLEPLWRLHVANVRPVVILPRSAVELKEVRHGSLQKVRLQPVTCVVHDDHTRRTPDDRLLPGGVREDGGVHVTGLGTHLQPSKSGSRSNIGARSLRYCPCVRGSSIFSHSSSQARRHRCT